MSDDGGIVVLKELVAVRRRPGMYIGGTDRDGLYRLLWEVVGNVVDQHLARSATELRVEIDGDGWVTVTDDGPGISVDYHPIHEKTVLEVVLTTLHCGGTYDGHFPHVHLAFEMAGLGLVVVNALSERFEIETTREGVRWGQAYERGEAAGGLRRIRSSSVEGTSVRFHPDPQIFSTVDFDLEEVRRRLQELAWLNPFLRIFFQGERLLARGGMRSWVEGLARREAKVEALYSTSQSFDGVFVDLALAWSATSDPTLRSFVNMHETRTGAHVDGLWRGLSAYAATLGAAVRGIEAVRQALAAGLVGIVSVGLYAPRFGGPTRKHLTSPIAGKVVRRALEHDLPDSLDHDARLRSFLQHRLGFTWR